MPAGSGRFSFQWYRNGAPLAGATNVHCTLTNLLWADSGAQLYCVVSRLGPCASANPTPSRTATVTVKPILPTIFFYVAVQEKERFGFNFRTVPGGQYQVDYTDDLAARAWAPLGPVRIASGTFLQVVDDSNYFTNQHRFYRVVRIP